MRLHEAIETVLITPGSFAISNPKFINERSGAFVTLAVGRPNTEHNPLFLNFPASYTLLGTGIEGRDFITYGVMGSTVFSPTPNDFVRDDWEIYHLELK